VLIVAFATSLTRRSLLTVGDEEPTAVRLTQRSLVAEATLARLVVAGSLGGRLQIARREGNW
jgi:hypothetical protein